MKYNLSDGKLALLQMNYRYTEIGTLLFYFYYLFKFLIASIFFFIYNSNHINIRFYLAIYKTLHKYELIHIIYNIYLD